MAIMFYNRTRARGREGENAILRNSLNDFDDVLASEKKNPDGKRKKGKFEGQGGTRARLKRQME